MALTAAGTAFAFDHETAGGKRLRGPEASQHIVPGVRRIADQEPIEGLGCEPALLAGVAGRPRFGAQQRLPMCGDLAHERREIGFVAAATIVGARLARDLDTGSRGEFLDGLREGEAVVVHEEAERGAMRTASEAVVELLVGAHPERGRLLAVEGAASLVLAPRFLERHARTDQFDDIGPRDQIVDEGLWDAPAHGR